MIDRRDGQRLRGIADGFGTGGEPCPQLSHSGGCAGRRAVIRVRGGFDHTDRRIRNRARADQLRERVAFVLGDPFIQQRRADDFHPCGQTSDVGFAKLELRSVSRACDLLHQMFRGGLFDDRRRLAGLLFQCGRKGRWRGDLHRRVGCWRVLLREAGEGDDNFCPHVFAAEERDLPLMVIDDDFGDGQPQPRAPLGPAVRTVALGEFFKHRRLRGSLNAGAEVADRNAQLIPDRVQGNQDLPAVFRKLHRVGKEVIQHLHQPFGVAIGQQHIVIGRIDTAQ